MNGLPRVYVVNFAGHDYTPAEKYGEIKWIVKGYVSLQSLDRVIYDVQQAIEDSRPNDFLCISGTAFLNAAAATLWYQKHGVVRFLVFDFKNKHYRETTISSWHTKQLENG